MYSGIRDGTVDVLTLDVSWSGMFAPYLVDLQPFMSPALIRSYVQGAIKTNTVNGKLIALPLW